MLSSGGFFCCQTPFVDPVTKPTYADTSRVLTEMYNKTMYSNSAVFQIQEN